MGLRGKLLQIIALPGVVIIIFAIVAAAAAAATTARMPTKPKPDCRSKCGDVEIPFPFGFTEGCYLDDSFRITCENSSTPNSPMIGNISVTNISTDTHEIHVMNWVGRECYQRDNSYYTNQTWLTLPQYTISNSKNRFTVIGCDTIAFLSGFQNGEEFKIGCSSQCPTPTNVGNGSCSGVGCCELRFPYGLKNISVEVRSFNNHSNVKNFNPCGYAFVVEKGQFNFSSDYLKNYTNQTVPLVLDWVVGNLTCDKAQKEPNFACKENSECNTIQGGYRCQCKQGYRGNPYLLEDEGGCKDIDECERPTLNNCTTKQYCTNKKGNYTCGCPKLCRGDGRKDGDGCSVDVALAIMVSIGIVMSFIAMLGGGSLLYLVFRKRISIKLKAQFFQRNGGLILEWHLREQGSIAKRAKIFTYEEMKKATNNYEESRIIGKGGFGIVYKGSLPNNTIVAIKKTNIVDLKHVRDQFIEEIILLSKIDHKNVVKLLGCCLETEVPLLVYEFVPKGTLFDYIRNESNISTKLWEWETRLRIAAETADALWYLHSLPIIHRDVKPSNILLDDNFTAKVSDFGISKSIPQDQNELATAVHGTSEYLDPEYKETKLLTMQSDVYSFGVVLIVLLTGMDVVKYFLSSFKENRLSELLDHDHIVEEGNKEQIDEVANLAEMCLRLKGDERPTMEELRNELEGIRKTDAFIG